jgi:two-component system chemotaxis sensor kinase CheA
LNPIHQKLAAIFQSEHAEHLEHIRSILALLENVEGTKGRTEVDEAFRRAHSLKGAARAVDLEEVEGLASGLETLFARVREGTLTLDRGITRVIYQVLEASEDCVSAFRENRTPEEPAAALRAMEELLGNKAPRPAQPPAFPSKTAGAPISTQAATPAAASAAVPTAAPAGLPADMVRMPAEHLDRLVRSTSRMLTESRRQAAITPELDILGGQIARMQMECAAFRKLSAARLRRLAAQPEYSSVIRHIESLEQMVRALAAQSMTTRRMQQRYAWDTLRSGEELQRDMWSARMAPAEDIFEGFRKMVRDLAREESKEIDFRLTGSGVRADRIVLQALKDPVMHLLRNAISHGIETAAERAGKGKSAVGSLTLRLDSQGGRLIAEVEDDGKGVDLEKVAKVLAEAEPEAAHSPEELAQAIFRPGFSTSATVNRLSGRGMGLSVVYETVHRLQGSVTLKPKEGPGASFLLSVPLSVSTSHLLLLTCSGQTFGVPTHGIERLYRIRPEHVETQEGKPVAILEGQAVPLYGLAHLLQIADPSQGQSGDLLPVMLLKSGPRRFAVWVDEFLTERDALIQELGMPCPATGHISGGALLRDGTPFMVLNPAGLCASCSPSAAGPLPQREQSAKAAAVTPEILVADDSITSRSLERSILEAHGFRVRVAVDGLEALQMLRIEKADLVITDIQMPRLDGFGLVEALKSDSRLKGIPVIIISSLDSVEDRERGLLLGADGYVVKRKFDQMELLEAIGQLI